MLSVNVYLAPVSNAKTNRRDILDFIPIIIGTAIDFFLSVLPRTDTPFFESVKVYFVRK